jgi:hypothetical protein
MNRIRIEIAIKVAPRGLPTCLRRAWGVSDSGVGVDAEDSECEMVVLRRKSWVTAMPIEAKEREVRSHARKVRSVEL